MYLNVDDNLLGFMNLEEKIKEINEYVTIKIIDTKAYIYDGIIDYGFVFGRYDESNPSYQLINLRSEKSILELEEIKDIFADTELSLYDDYDNLERKGNVSIIDCECLIAQTGSILVSEATAGSRAAYSCADTLLIFARPSQFVAKMKDAFALMKDKYGDDQPAGMTIISGASYSTDIDNVLVVGAFGCKQIALFLVE